jgi:putative thymidine phosphorylase
MKLKVKDLDIATGGILIAILNHKDASKLDIFSGDRVAVKFKNRKINCIVDISVSDKMIPEGRIGLFEEVLAQLKIREGNIIDVVDIGKPKSITHIRKKLYGHRLNYQEFYEIVKDITDDYLTDIEKTYFVSSCFINGLSDQEVVDLTRAMVDTGKKINFNGIILDKHCVGGVPGNRTTMIVTPIIAAAGFIMPKTSSRAITSPAGTADTMECLANVSLSEKEIKHVIKKSNACIVHGGAINLAPADDKIILVEHPLAIDAEGQLIASVMAKKYSVSANHVLIDIPMGKSTKSQNEQEAKHLKRKFEFIGKKLNMDVKVIITDGSQPIGKGIGPLLEAKDVMGVLSNDPNAPEDLKEKSLQLAGLLLKMSGKYKNGYKKAKEILESGQALKKMNEIISLQGKKKEVKLAKHSYDIKAKKSGVIKEINNRTIAKIARIAGAPQDKAAGLYLYKKVGDKVKKDEILFKIYSNSESRLKLAKEIYQNFDCFIF